MNIKEASIRLNRPKVEGQLRHMLNTVGAALATYGVVNDTQWQLYTGIGLAILAFVGSILASEKQ